MTELKLCCRVLIAGIGLFYLIYLDADFSRLLTLITELLVVGITFRLNGLLE